MSPNILLINCDDLGYGDLGCYGSTRNETPHLDALANNGLKLNSFYMGSPVCSASRAAMLTGCYPQRVGFGPTSVLFPGQELGLNSRETTIAAQLKRADYATKIIGKWHCGDQPEFLPTRHGFDSYFGIPFSNDMGRQVGNDGKMMDPPRPPLPLLRDETVIQQQPDQRGITERYTDEAMQFIRANKERPFFLYLAHMYVHVPLFVSKQFMDRSKNGAYGGAVACIDWSTGVLVDTLRELGLLDNTLIIFTSDNGSRARDEGGSNAPCRGTKATTWEGGQRVPGIVHWPDKIAAGRESDELITAMDLLPTLSRLAGVETLPELPIDGIDISEHLFDPDVPVANDTFYYYSWTKLEAVRVGDWKLSFRTHEQPDICELYNLRQDIGESNNLAAEHPEIVAQLEAVAARMRPVLGDTLHDIEGSECRPIGKVANAKPLTEYDPQHPYIIAAYDLPDMPTMAG